MAAYNREVAIRRSPPALGASGSVNASVIFNIMYSPYSTVLIYGILPMPAWALGGLWLAYDINGAVVRLHPFHVKASRHDYATPSTSMSVVFFSTVTVPCLTEGVSKLLPLCQPLHMCQVEVCCIAFLIAT